MSEPHTLDLAIDRLARLPGISLQDFDLSEHAFTGPELADMLAVQHARLSQDVQAISVQIAQWGRLTALARRRWQVAEREYRVWRDRYVLAVLTPQTDTTSWKKPTEKHVEAMYRSENVYAGYHEAIEEAEEVFNACNAVVEGLRAKKDMLRTFVIRALEDSSPRLAV